MARRTRTEPAFNTGAAPIDDVDDLPPGTALAPIDDIPEVEDATDRVMAMLSRVGAVGAEARLKIYRVREDKKLGYCCEMTPEAFEGYRHDGIRNEWGPGDYEIRLYCTRNGKFACYGLERATIEKPINANPIESAAPRADAALIDVLGKLAEGQNAILAKLAAPPPAPADPTEALSKAFGLMEQMRKAMGVDSAAKPASAVDQIREIVGLLDAAKEIRETVRGDEAAESDPMLALAGKGLDMVVSALANKPGNTAAVPQLPSVAIPPTMGTAPVAAPVAPPPAQDDPMQMQVNFALMWIGTKAAANANIDEVAERVYDDVPDDILEALAADNWRDAFRTLLPAFAEREDWYAKLRDKVIAIHAEESASPQPKSAA